MKKVGRYLWQAAASNSWICGLRSSTLIFLKGDCKKSEGSPVTRMRTVKRTWDLKRRSCYYAKWLKQDFVFKKANIWAILLFVLVSRLAGVTGQIAWNKCWYTSDTDTHWKSLSDCIVFLKGPPGHECAVQANSTLRPLDIVRGSPVKKGLTVCAGYLRLVKVVSYLIKIPCQIYVSNPCPDVGVALRLKNTWRYFLFAIK